MAAHEVDKGHCPEVGLLDPAVLFFHENKLLGPLGTTHGYEHTTVIGKLVHQRHGNLRAARRDNDPVIGSFLGPAHGAVIQLELDRKHAHVHEPFAGDVKKLLDALDSVDFRSEFGQDCGLIARSGAYFEHLHAGFHFKLLGHKGNDVRLGDGLALAYGQRAIGVCLIGQCLLHEEMPGERSHGAQYGRVGYAARLYLFAHHALS